MNHKRVYRLYVEEKLGLRRKRGRRRMPTTAARVPLQLPVRPDQVWTMDFTPGCVRQWAQVPNSEPDGRLHALRATHRGGHLVAGSARGAGAGRTEAKRPQAGGDRDRQRDRVYQSGDGSMGLRESGAAALHHARTAHGERLHRELQRQVPRRVSERELVPRSGRRAGEDRDLAVRLQPSAAALGARLSHPSGVCAEERGSVRLRSHGSAGRSRFFRCRV